MHRKWKRLTAIALGTALLSGCGTVHLNAPAGTRLLPEDAPVETRVERPVYYYLWGMRVFENSDNEAWTLVQEHQLREVRLSFTNTFMDGLVSIPGSFVSIVRRTIRVEGNR